LREEKPLDGITKYHTYEREGPLGIIVKQNSVFFNLDAFKNYVDFYGS
jgi:hypothetical protein